ncbi:MAG: BadF/BadG/BcrA/BcrD ATPase family protein [Deinococcales bacterium]
MLDSYVGIDGGGSKTQVVILQGANVIADFRRGGSYLPQIGVHAFLKLFQDIHQQLGYYCDRKSIKALVIGLPGYGATSNWKKELDEHMAKVFSGYIYDIYNDVELAREAAFNLAPGILALSGTGSMIWAKGSRGQRLTVGGWGHLFGDEGSGYAIGLRGLQLASHSHDGRISPSSLPEAIIKHFKLTSLWEVLDILYAKQDKRSEIAALSYLVAQEAEKGDKAAQQIIHEASHRLIEQIGIAHQRLGENLPVACVGGMFKLSTYHQQVGVGIAQLGLKEVVASSTSPALGAAKLAVRLGAN